jgi:hypothetical protein
VTTVLTTLALEKHAGEAYRQRFVRYTERVAEIDLSLISVKVMHPILGYGWSREFTARLVAEYRILLAMKATFPELPLPPSRVMDQFWHEHILDTQAYFRDCAHIAGDYIHHFPYFGMRSPADVERLLSALATERDLYVQCVGCEPPRDLWVVGATREYLMTLIDGRFVSPAAAEAAKLVSDVEL